MFSFIRKESRRTVRGFRLYHYYGLTGLAWPGLTLPFEIFTFIKADIIFDTAAVHEMTKNDFFSGRRYYEIAGVKKMTHEQNMVFC